MIPYISNLLPRYRQPSHLQLYIRNMDAKNTQGRTGTCIRAVTETFKEVALQLSSTWASRTRDKYSDNLGSGNQ